MEPDPDLPGLEALPPADQMAIGEALLTLLEGFGRRDADMLGSAYAEDADWLNAFGTRRRGRAEIVKYLHDLFADANFDEGQMEGPPVSSLRRLSDTVVAVSTSVRIAGQGLVGGGSIAARENHALHILQKQPDGRWLIVSDLYMDARTDRTYAEGS